MFTALHRDEQGNETLYSCTQVSKRTNHESPDGQTGCGPGIHLDLAPFSSPMGHVSAFIPYIQRPTAQQSGGRNAAAYIAPCVIVMNDSGKTVAKYDL